MITIDQAEKILITQRLCECNFNLSHTATSLGIGRTTLYRKMEKYEIRIIKNMSFTERIEVNLTP